MIGPDEKLFGQIAVGEGFITHEQLQECLTLKSESGADKTLWEIMIDRSYLDHHTTNRLLEQVDQQKTQIKAKQKVERFFGDIAVSRAFCSSEQMQKAIAEQKKRMQDGRNQRLGELCVEMGILTPEQVALVLDEQNRRIVVCSGCGSAYSVEGFPAGKRWRCKVCNSMLEVPGSPAFASVPINQLLSEQIEEAVAAPDIAPAETAGTPAKAEPTRFGNYYIIEKIARGGMGIIYKARQRGLDRIVALKVLIAGESASEETIKRFYLEAKSVAKLRHPNIVPIHEVGIHEGKHFFTMDFIHGENLRHIILNQKINLHWALELTAKVAKALHYAHEHGVVHRDVKPENILIDETGEPQITDFGLAMDIETDANITQAGVVMGTPAYMSPEQARGERASLDNRSDVYSLGAVLYEMLTGQQIFSFEGPIGLSSLLKTISQDPTPPRRLNPRIPREVETMVAKAIEKEPDRRYQSSSDYAQDIDRYLTGEPILARPPSFSYRTWKKIKKYKVVSASMLSAIIAIAVVAVYFINERIDFRRRQEEQFQKYITEAAEFLEKGKFFEAKEFYNKADGMRPRDPAVIRGLTRAEYGLAQKEKLREEQEAKTRAIRAAAEGNGLLAQARESLSAGNRFDAKAKLWDAIREFDRALTNDQANETATRGLYSAAVKLGQLNMEDKEYGVAGFVFSFAERLGIDNDKAKGLVLAANRARRKAEDFEKLLVKANKLMSDGSWDEALRQLQLAAEFEGISDEKRSEVRDRIKDTSYSRHFWEGENERRKGNNSAAIEAYIKAESFKKTPEIEERLRSVHYDRLVRKGNRHFAREEYAEALRVNIEARQYANNQAEITELIEQVRDAGFQRHMELGLTSKASKDWDKSIEYLERALSFRPENQEARKLKVEISAAASCPEGMVFLFSGKTSLGSTVPDDRNPLREELVGSFYMDKYEVTNHGYKAFVDARGYSDEKYWDPEGFKQIASFVDRTGKPGPATWEDGTFPQGKGNFPVTGVSWYEARAYALWTGKRLPTEEEWEKAASYNPENEIKSIYPWGDEWNPDNGNFTEDEPAKVGSFPVDISSVGCYDMGGNAFEWTSSRYKEEYRVIRGGGIGLSESTLKRFARAVKRKCPKPSYRSASTGFRCALTPEK